MDELERLQARVDEAESRAAEMERRYDEVTVAMRKLETARDAEIAELRAWIAQYRKTAPLLGNPGGRAGGPGNGE